MPSTYSSLKIQLMATGENNTTWGDVTNLNLGTAIEEAIVGSADVAFSNANVTLTLTDTNASQTARNMRLNLTGTATAGYNLVVPAIEKPYIINNGTDGTITVKNATGTGIAVPAGRTMWVYNDGTNVVDAVTRLSSLTLGTALTVASGGTGANTLTSGYLVKGNGTSAVSASVVYDTGTNVGIGTTNPVALLAVSNAGAAGFEINPTGGVGGGATIATYNRGTAAYTSLTTYSSTMTWYAGGSTRAMDLDSSGNLGIGTTTPGAKLGLGGSADISMKNTANTSGFDIGLLGGSADSVAYIYQRASAAMAFGTSNSTRMLLDSAGNLGIGTSSPLALLHLNKASGASDIRFSTAGTLYGITYASASDYTINSVTSIPLILGTNNTERMRIDSSGNVMIGTTTAAQLLTLGSTTAAAAGLNQRTTATDFNIVPSNSAAGGVNISCGWVSGGQGPMRFSNTAGEMARFDSSGNLGVGTTSPGAKVDVNGVIRSTGTGAILTISQRSTGTGDAWGIYSQSGEFNIYNYSASASRLTLSSTGAVTSPDLADAVGYKGVPQNQQTSGYTLALSDMGKHVFATAASFTITIPPNSSVAFPVGSAITIFCGDATKTLAPGSGVTLIQAGTSNTGSRTLAINALVTLVKLQTNTWVVSGAGLS